MKNLPRHELYFHTGQCPTVLVQLSGEAKTYQGGYAGVYTLREGGTTNSRQDWISADGKNAIWYEGGYWNLGYWNLGRVSDRGTSTRFMYTSTTSPQLPVYAGNKWSYWNKEAWVQNDDVQVMCAKTST